MLYMKIQRKFMPEEITKKKLWAIENAIAQQRLEGVELPEAFISDLHRAARGEITMEDVRANIGKRFKDEQILKP
jgi:hypothetical protein